MKTLHQNPSAARKCDATLAGELLHPPLSFFYIRLLYSLQAISLQADMLIEGIASSWKQLLPRKVKSRDASLKVETKIVL